MVQFITSQVNRVLAEMETVKIGTLTNEQQTSNLDKLHELENDIQAQMNKVQKKLNELYELKCSVEKRIIDFKPVESASEKIVVKTLFNGMFEIGPFPVASTTQMDVKKAIDQVCGIPAESIRIIVEGGKHFTDDATLIMKTFIKRPYLIHVIQKMERAGADKADAVMKESGLFS